MRLSTAGFHRNSINAILEQQPPVCHVWRRRDRFDPELALAEAAGEVAQQIEGLGQHVLPRHRLQLRDVDGEAGAVPRRRIGAHHG